MGTNQREGHRRPIPASWPTLALVLILLVAAGLRFVGLDWDEGTHLHPDERFLTTVEASISPTFSISEYFTTATSPLNPRNRGHGFFVYGTLPIFLVRYVAEGINAACVSSAGCTHHYVGYDGVHLVGRALSAVADLATIVVLFAIGRRLYDDRVGLLAALLAWAAVLPIQHAHFFTVDNFATLFVALSLYFAIRIAQGAERHNWALFGAAFGMALACKISIWPLGLVFMVASLLRAERAQLDDMLTGMATAGLITFVAFRLFQPYAFAGPAYDAEALSEEQFNTAVLAAPRWWAKAYDVLPGPIRATLLPSPRWLENMRAIRNQMTGDVDIPFNHQWTDRKPILFPWKNMVLYGMGPLLGLACWLGWAGAMYQIVRRRRGWRQHLLPVLWIAILFLYQGTQWVKAMRYQLPIYPFLILLAAWGLVSIWDRSRSGQVTRSGLLAEQRGDAAEPAVPASGISGGRARRWRRLAAGLIVLVALPTYLWAFCFTNIYRRPATRVAAARWIYQNVPTGATLLYETEGEARELQLPLRTSEYGQDGALYITPFEMPADGTLTGVRMNHLSDLWLDWETEVFRVALTTNAADLSELAYSSRAIDLHQARDIRGDPYVFDLSPVPLTAGQRYYLITEAVAGAPVRSTGAFLVNESSWDDGLPLRIDGLDGATMYESAPLELYWEDEEAKRERMLSLLDQGDYLFITSSRQLGSITRLPPRYPLTIAYYQALFEGQLGYELAETFMADLHIGPLKINDVFGALGWGEEPAVGWPPPGSWAAEEAFSVYDHPPVWILRKRPDYSAAQVRAVLEAVDLSDQRFVIPLDYTEELKAERRARLLDALLPGGQEPREEEQRSMLLPPETLAEQRAGGTWSEMFNPDGVLTRRPALGAAVWWFYAAFLGWLAFPLAFVTLGGLPSKGYLVSRTLGLLIVSWLSWVAASLGLLPYSRGTILLATFLLAAAGLGLAWGRRRTMIRFVRTHWRRLLMWEGAALLLYVLWLLIRNGNPDLWHPRFGGEKPMDFAFLNAVLKSTSFPPYDPWLAGGYVNYYYFGFVLLGSLIKPLGIPPYVAYNLALPMLASLTGMGAFSIAFDLVEGLRRRFGSGSAAETAAKWSRKALAAGAAAAVAVVLLGNLGQVWTVVAGWNRMGGEEGSLLEQTAQGAWSWVTGKPMAVYRGSWYWDATRIIPPGEGEAGPITEFPFFTFLYADLHAHMVDMPLVFLALAWALGLARSADAGRERRGGGILAAVPTWLITWIVGGMAFGALRATNTWEWPTFLGVGAVAAVYWALQWQTRVGKGWLAVAGLGLAALVGLNFLFFLPYSKSFVPAYTDVMRWKGGITPVWAYFAVHGLFLFLLVTLLGREFVDWTRHLTEGQLERLEPWGCLIGLGVLAFLALMVGSLVLGVPVGPLVLLMMAPAGLLALQSRLPAERRAVLMLLTLGLALTLAVELVVLAGDISRMNTVFKFYLQVWLIFSAIGGAALVWSWESVRRWPSALRSAWLALLGMLVVASALYPPTAARAKIDDRFHEGQEPGLDGMAYMLTATHHDREQELELVHDYHAIRWLQDNVTGSPVIMEANTYPTIYGWGNRMSIYTGLPAVVGWEWHTRQHRAGFAGATDEVRGRANDVITFYNTPMAQQAMDILTAYEVEYVIVGPLERAYYAPAGLAKFSPMTEAGSLEEVYRNEGAVIYRVAP